MKVALLLDQRRQNWHELEELLTQVERKAHRLRGPRLARFAALYRSACADLALADAYQLPNNTVNYLHQLVGRAHGQLYRSQSFRLSEWGRELFVDLPRRLYVDNCLRLSFAVFWGFFLLTMVVAYANPAFGERVLGKEQLVSMESMHSNSVGGRDVNSGLVMVGFYVQHNTSIGLRCFAWGLLFGIGGLFDIVSNAVILGSVFGHMARSSSADNFYQFVTAHGPFELTAIVLSGAAGMRLGFSLVDSRGLSRLEALTVSAREAMPAMCLAMVLFCLAAVIEGLISPSALPYWTKATVGAASSGLLMFYFVLLGRPPRVDDATG